MPITSEKDPLLLRVIQLLRLYREEYTTDDPDLAFRKNVRKEMFEVLEQFDDRSSR